MTTYSPVQLQPEDFEPALWPSESLEPETKVLVVSTSLLIDRALMYTRLLDVLSEQATVKLWASSADDAHYRDIWGSLRAEVEVMPKVRPFKEFPYNYLRRLNEYTWDLRNRSLSRESMFRHGRTTG